MSAIILDTETHTIDGYPIEISHSPCSFEHGVLKVDHSHNFDQYFSCPEPISFGAMAVHHIIESDLVDCPSYDEFRLPAGVTYIIGHNIDYDLAALLKAGVNCNHIKPICTLKLARHFYPNESSHKLGALSLPSPRWFRSYSFI